MAVNLNWNLLGRLPDFGAAWDQGRQKRASRWAGDAMRDRDYGGAADAYYQHGMVREGAAMDEAGDRQAERERASAARLTAEQKALATERLEGIKRAVAPLAKYKPEERDAAWARAEQSARLAGLDDDTIKAVRDMNKSDESLGIFGAQIERQKLQFMDLGNGAHVAVDPMTGEEKKRWQGPVKLGPEDELIDPGGWTGGSPPAMSPGMGADPRQPGGKFDTDDVFGALIMQESGGRAGAIGPATKYGRALGLTQMLPATAEEMARKVGVPFNQARLRGTSDKDREYQRMLGRAYFDEGLQKYGGDYEKALMYYHGGPDEALWGPKTRGYAKAVMGRVQPYDVASAGATPPPPGDGPRVLARGRPKPAKEKGRLWSPAEVEAAGFLKGTIVEEDANGNRQVLQKPESRNNDATKLRREFEGKPEIKKYRTVENSYNTIRTLAKSPSAANDIALIFSYMRMLDPDSVVREGEFATAQNAASVPDQVRNIYNKALSGERLNERQRADFMRSAGSVFEVRRQEFATTGQQYRQYAEEDGFDPDRVVPLNSISPQGKKQEPGWTRSIPKAQLDKAKTFAGSTGAAGSRQNPSVPRNAQEYGRLPSGTFYIFTDGSVRRKP
jgi:hypothetical protein